MRSMRLFLARWQNWSGLLMVLFFVFVAVAAPVLAPQDPENPGTVKVVGRAVDFRPQPPSQVAPLGTLPGQICIYHSLVWGTRSAVTFGLVVAVFTAGVGVLAGTISAYFGGKLNDIIMRITDAFLAFPVIAGVVLVQQLVSISIYNYGIHVYPNGLIGMFDASGTFVDASSGLPFLYKFLLELNPVMIALVLFSWMPYARMMNTIVLRLKQTEYVQAARALGAGHSTLIFKHLIPNAIAPVIVMAARDVGGMVLLQATFTFIGLGGDSMWGMLLVKGRDWIIGPGGNILTFWWVFLPATLALLLFGIGWNVLGDGLNEVLNPRTRQKTRQTGGAASG
jgi:peptide/nickel transport system permease protein